MTKTGVKRPNATKRGPIMTKQERLQQQERLYQSHPTTAQHAATQAPNGNGDHGGNAHKRVVRSAAEAPSAAPSDIPAPAAPLIDHTAGELLAGSGASHEVEIAPGEEIRDTSGHRYFRRRPFAATSASITHEVISAPTLDSGPKTFFESAREILFGKAIPTESASHERIGKVKALALLSSDALSSVAYGTEASLAILVTAGAGLALINLWIGAAIIILLAIVAFSYTQTIKHYPTGGGSYIVAKAHLGEIPGLVAAAALLLDYVLTVSVSVSAGVDAVKSAFPELAPLGVAIGVVFIALIVIINLRGVRESGSIFAIPTYLFVGSYLITIVAGFVKAIALGGLAHPIPEHITPLFGNERLNIFLILTAFASGCSAMTGTEAIADGVPVFRGATPRDQSRNAAQTLVIMASLLAIMYGGTSFLAWRFGITPFPNSQPTVLHQISSFIWGSSPLGRAATVLFDFATTLILTLAANTSFSDFPRLSSILARDHYLPHFFAARGGRLAFNTGIIVLGVLSSALLVVFGGSTDALINLYALGVFTAFTMSQAGMVRRWTVEKATEPHWRVGRAVSFTGAVATGIVTLIIIVSKTPRGAWVVLILVPLLVLLFKGIHRHYDRVAERVAKMSVKAPKNIHHLIVVPVANLDKLAMQGLAYARAITPHVIAVHVATEGDKGEAISQEWDALIGKKFLRGGPIPDEDAIPDDSVEHRELVRNGPELVIIESPYRVLERPLIKYIDKLRKDHPHDLITVVLPEYVPRHFWERLLHNQTAFRLKFGLLGRSLVVTSNVPYRFENDADSDEAAQGPVVANTSAPSANT
jgi:amino acid transporter